MSIQNPAAPWYYISNVMDIDSPALAVFPERVQQNILWAIQMTGTPERLRPHVKTHKSMEPAKLMMQAGITKFKCATIAETEMLAQCRAQDVLLAYQALGPKLARFIALVKKYPGTAFSCLCDNISAAQEQAKAFMMAGLTIPVFIDLNVGMNRTGIEPGLPAIALAEFITGAKGIRLEGLHAYDGHLRDNDFETRKQKCDAAFSLIEEFKTDLAGKGISINKIIAGGSPTFSIHCYRQSIECSPGTFVYWDKGYADLCPEQPFLPAAILISRIISFPQMGRICLDLGHKSVAAENDISRRVFFPQAPHFKFVSQSEEHLVVEAGDNHDYRVGDVLYGLPYHICPTVALYEKVYTVEEGKVSGEWRTIARDRKITI